MINPNSPNTVRQLNPPKPPNKIKNVYGQVVPLRSRKNQPDQGDGLRLDGEPMRTLRARGLSREVAALSIWFTREEGDGKSAQARPKLEVALAFLNTYADQKGLVMPPESALKAPASQPEELHEQLAVVLPFRQRPVETSGADAEPQI